MPASRIDKFSAEGPNAGVQVQNSSFTRLANLEFSWATSRAGQAKASEPPQQLALSKPIAIVS